MTVEELTIRSSIQIYQADKQIMKPEGFGTGCIVKYSGHTLLLSVSHVTNDDGLTTFLETNLPPENNTTPLKPIGGLVYYDVFKVTENTDLSDFENLVENNGERIDITFAKLTEQFELKQPAMDFGCFQIEDSDDIIMKLMYLLGHSFAFIFFSAGLTLIFTIISMFFTKFRWKLVFRIFIITWTLALIMMIFFG